MAGMGPSAACPVRGEKLRKLPFRDRPPIAAILVLDAAGLRARPARGGKGHLQRGPYSFSTSASVETAGCRQDGTEGGHPCQQSRSLHRGTPREAFDHRAFSGCLDHTQKFRRTHAAGQDHRALTGAHRCAHISALISGKLSFILVRINPEQGFVCRHHMNLPFARCSKSAGAT